MQFFAITIKIFFLEADVDPGALKLSERLDYNKQLKKLKKEKSDQQHPNAQVYIIQGVHLEGWTRSFITWLKHGDCFIAWLSCSFIPWLKRGIAEEWLKLGARQLRLVLLLSYGNSAWLKKNEDEIEILLRSTHCAYGLKAIEQSRKV